MTFGRFSSFATILFSIELLNTPSKFTGTALDPVGMRAATSTDEYRNTQAHQWLDISFKGDA